MRGLVAEKDWAIPRRGKAAEAQMKARVRGRYFMNFGWDGGDGARGTTAAPVAWHWPRGLRKKILPVFAGANNKDQIHSGTSKIANLALNPRPVGISLQICAPLPGPGCGLCLPLSAGPSRRIPMENPRPSPRLRPLLPPGKPIGRLAVRRRLHPRRIPIGPPRPIAMESSSDRTDR